VQAGRAPKRPALEVLMSEQTEPAQAVGSGIVHSSEARAARGAEGAAGAASNFANGGGRLLSHVRVHLIFWGRSWTGLPVPTPTVGQCVDAVVTMLASNYMNSLSQYGVSRGTLGSVTTVDAAIGGSPADPPNPFTDTNVSQLVEHLRTAGRIPTGDIGSSGQGLYVVVMPPNVANSNGNVIGEHSFYTALTPFPTRVPFAWVTQSSVDSFSEVFSHELVEATTDPEGSGWTSTTACGPNHGGWCEIGDVCEGNTARVHGVFVQRYWSNSDSRCVVPDDPKVSTDSKTHKDSKDNKDRKDTKDAKERKEGAKEKEAAKEREAPLTSAPVADPQQIFDQLKQVAAQLQGLIDQLGQAGAHSFIEPSERPAVDDG
jgi:hypothetical protein